MEVCCVSFTVLKTITTRLNAFTRSCLFNATAVQITAL